jgi:hypothetical protein
MKTEEFKFVRPLPKGLFHNNFSLPSIGLADPQSVLDSAITSIRMKSIEKTLSRPQTPFLAMGQMDIERAKERFRSLSGSSDFIPVHFLGEVLREMGLFVDEEDIEDLKASLDAKDGQGLCFADISEIAAFMQSELAARIDQHPQQPQEPQVGFQ